MPQSAKSASCHHHSPSRTPSSAFTVQLPVHLAGLIAVIFAYGAIGATVIGLLGPVFIPWMVFEKTDFLFWGWLKAFVGFEFYKVVAAATMSVMSHLMITYLTSGAMNVNDPRRLVYLMPGLADDVFRCWICFAQDSDHDRQSVLWPCRRS